MIANAPPNEGFVLVLVPPKSWVNALLWLYDVYENAKVYRPPCPFKADQLIQPLPKVYLNLSEVDQSQIEAVGRNQGVERKSW